MKIINIIIYYHYLTNDSLFPLIQQQNLNNWENNTPPKFFLIDSYSELTDQMFINRNNINIQVNLESEFIVNEPVRIEVETTKGFSLVDTKKIDISIFNKYNKNESITATIDSYTLGKYLFYVTPEYSGEYIINISAKVQGATFLKSETFNVK